MKAKERERQAGFTLIELIIAMLVTLIISGAIFGLMSQGQTAFRQEPEKSDRQQQIRVAMDMIQRDIANAGMLVPGYMQVFTANDPPPALTLLDGFGYRNSTGSGAYTGSFKYPFPNSPQTIKAPDALQIIGNTGVCPTSDVCMINVNTTSVMLTEPPPPCFANPTIVLFAGPKLPAGQDPGDPSCEDCYKQTSDPTWSSDIEWVCQPKAGGGTNACKDGDSQKNGHAVAPHGASDLNDTGKPNQCFCTMSQIDITRYEIWIDAEGVPNLWRSPTGGQNADDLKGNCGGGGAGFGTNNWWLVARGIEDLQVQYRHGDGDWRDSPYDVCPVGVGFTCIPPGGGESLLVREVRVTLSARVFGQNLMQGETQPGDATSRGVRGSLTSVTSPRMALYTLSRVDPSNTQHWQ